MTDEPNPSDCAVLQELWLGAPSNMPSMFADRAELKAAWEKYRTVVMMLYAELGRRPMAWWMFECPPGLRYDDDREQSILWSAGLLGADERAELEAHWRQEFEAAFSRHGRDAKARRRCFRDADIPRSLIKAWLAERKRRGRTIRRLKDLPVRDAGEDPSQGEAKASHSGTV